MATCEKREIKMEPPPVEYVLTLSKYEASVLALALQAIRSNGTVGDISAALDRALGVTK